MQPAQPSPLLPTLTLTDRKPSLEITSPRLSGERKASNPDLSKTLQRKFSTVFEKQSPKSPRNSRSDKVDSPRHPSQTPVFFVRIPVKIRINEYLEIDEGDVITVRSIEPEKGLCIVQNNKQAGVIPAKHLFADRHTSNVYLGALEVLLKHPPLFQQIVDIDAPEFPHKLPKLVALLTVRKILQIALKTLFINEFTAKNLNPALREKTAAVQLALATIDCSDQKKMADFQKDFVMQAVKSIKMELKQKKPESHVISATLEKSFEYLQNQLAQNKIPHTFGLVFRALKEAYPHYKQDVSLASLQGAILFLRYLAPALMQPKEKCGIKKIKDHKLLCDFAKTLQLLSNQTLLEKTHPFYDIKTCLEKLHEPMVSLLSKIALIPQPEIQAGMYVKEAASMYGLIVRCGRTFEDNKELQDTLDSLERHWGKAPKQSIEYDNEVPMLVEIDLLSSKLQQASLV